ncbi:polyketide synthase dehydratase domain-containing protein, partial [Streptomyces sp. NPDC059861]|uniref:polyketide synthase dehydratase domain-containing protein n=1 Tax=Streptomyces sp. NPDC059861 TaxID=3346974 RepID=UPI0036689E3B
SRPEREEPAGDHPWTLNAQGTLTAGETVEGEPLTAWPPAGAEEVPLDGAYERLEELGYAYGPAFQGLKRAWRGQDEMFAEVVLPDGPDADAGRYLLHPALLDAALHTLLPGVVDPDRQALVPFGWEGVTVHAVGADTVRVRFSLEASDMVGMTVADGAGAPVATVESLSLRPLSKDALRTAAASGTGDGLHTVRWTPLPDTTPTTTPEAAIPTAAVDVLEIVSGGRTPRDVTTDTLHAVQTFLTDDTKHDTTLLVITRGALAIGTEDITDLPAAGVTGLIRVAQTEHPGRIVLADLPPHTPIDTTTLLTTGQPQLALRDNTLHTPHLTPYNPTTSTSTRDTGPHWDQGTILITGATGTLGTHLARHLVTHHHAKHLLL